MARTTKQLSGGGKDKFLHALVAQVADLPAGAAERVGAALADGIAEVRVRREVWETLRSAPVGLEKKAPVITKSGASRPIATKPAVAATVEVAATFDPFAFSAVAVLTRKGKAALAVEFEKIDTAENLRALATAQHLALDPVLSDVADIRTALVAATERRIAERKAAAS